MSQTTKTTTREARRAAEDRVIAAAVRGLLREGYRVSVDNGEDQPITASRDARAIIAELRQTDEDYLNVSDAQGVGQGFVWLIYGNDPAEVIADYTTNLDGALTEALSIAARMQ